MNYYERHIGDYLKDTAHLSLLEHGVYGRLLDVYYTREAPIPAAQVERLIGVRSRDEREALRNVLQEFFQLDGDLLRHGRCDREIDRYQLKQRKAAASANARWKKGQPDTERNADAMRTHMRTHSEGNAPSNQTPDTNKASASVEHEKAGAPPFGPDGPARAVFQKIECGEGAGGVPPDALRLAGVCVDAAAAMAAAGLTDASASHPGLRALVAAGMTPDELADAARAAAKAGKGFAWALARAEGRRRDAAATAPLPGAPQPDAPLDPSSAAAIKADAQRLGIGEWQQVDGQGRTVPWAEYAARVNAARAEAARAERGSEVAA